MRKVTNVSNRPLYIGDSSSVDCTCDILNKNEAIAHYVNTMFSRTNQMFEYSGLPDTIPPEMLELFLQTNGHVCITKIDGNLYALAGRPGGPPDPYFRRTHYVVANPALNISKTLSASLIIFLRLELLIMTAIAYTSRTTQKKWD